MEIFKKKENKEKIKIFVLEFYFNLPSGDGFNEPKHCPAVS